MSCLLIKREQKCVLLHIMTLFHAFPEIYTKRYRMRLSERASKKHTKSEFIRIKKKTNKTNFPTENYDDEQLHHHTKTTSNWNARKRERERDRNQKYHRLNSSATIGHALYLFETNCYFWDVQENNTPATHARTHKMHILHLIFCVCDFKSKQLEQLHFKCLA